jgi:hypothetical protein
MKNNIGGEEGPNAPPPISKRGDVEDGRAVLNLPDGGEHHQRGQQGQNERNTIGTDREADRRIGEDSRACR